MNQTFSLARFVRLNRWFWATKRRNYLIAAIAMLPIISMLPLQVLGDSHRLMLVGAQRNDAGFLLIISLFITVCIGSDVFRALYKQESAVTYLMIPASRVEKFGLALFYWVIALLLLCLAFFSIEAIIFAIANSDLPASESRRYISSLALYTSSTDQLLVAVYSVMGAQALTLLGSLFFRQGVLIRNLVLLIGTVIGLSVLYQLIVGSQIAYSYRTGSAFPFTSIPIYVVVRPVGEFAPPAWLMYLTYGGTLLMLWVIARIRFNEIER